MGALRPGPRTPGRLERGHRVQARAQRVPRTIDAAAWSRRLPVRIIAGEWRGRRIDAPKGDAVRPTLDRVREAWMSMVHTELPGARVLDLFSGSGALGLEALSRGAASVDFVESDPTAFRVLRENIDLLDAGSRCTVYREN